MIDAVVSTAALIGSLAGLPQVIRIVRYRAPQSVVGWAMATKGSAAVTALGVQKAAPLVVVSPSATATVIAATGVVASLKCRSTFDG